MIKAPPEFGDKYIVVEIGEAGAKIEAFGFKGMSCKGATKPFEDALGGKITERKDKAEGDVVRIQI